MTTKLTETEAGAEILKKVNEKKEGSNGLAGRIPSSVGERMSDGTLALAGGALMLVMGARALSKNRKRGVVKMLAGVALVGHGLRRSRRGASTTESEDEQSSDVEGTEGGTSTTVRHDTEESETDVAEEVAEQPGASDDDSEDADADEDDDSEDSDTDTDTDDDEDEESDADADEDEEADADTDEDDEADADADEDDDGDSALSSDDDHKYET